ncbi:mRNA cap guanine-N7 methyltransferase [Camponotus floridanus]|uniref:mRNA cap guanine-N(7) methyltransferase n=1 Tax=Camponotus floridanus TaxID=104421 RepID=E2AAT3_CAMFO|nr:mRNA cap guanine-N7 methyltransferase [Camponotus floridanus]EFN69462.1 mRNA cap guanine-N7 methyltransferase [Camponotus floridanus]
MSALHVKTKGKAEEKQHKSDTEKFCTTMIKTEILSETDKSADLEIPQSRKHKLSPDCEHVSKVAKYDNEEDALSASTSVPSDLTTSGNNEKSNDKSNTGRSTDNTVLVADHYNMLEEKGLSFRNQSRIVYMRNFNNWIKSMLIHEYVVKLKQGKSFGASLRVLDMCCGKGGDLLKWKKANISHLICTDIAQVSLEQCQQRYSDMVNRKGSKDRGFAPIFTAEFITADCTKVRLREKFADPSMQLDFVSCQFAFHYSFESLPQAECMLRNAGESLKPGGYFIGTIPDAYDLVSRWQKCDGNKFGNDVYSIEFICEDKTKPPLFGAKYNFHLDGVVDCPEFLVHLPTLRKLASKYGLELIAFERFDEYYERFKDEGRSLLGNMQALETYPPYHETPLLGDPEQDYQHAVRYMQNLPANHRKIGTLSQSEWEVTSLYAIFAFQKMKTIWNSEGKPEYVKL